MTEQGDTTRGREYSREQAVALALFEPVAGKLPGKARRMLLLALASQAAASTSDDERGERAGRDRVLSAPLPGMDAQRQAIVASAVALQRAKVRPQREPAFVWLSDKHQRTALRLAAVLRIAGAIEAEPGDLRVEHDGDKTTVTIGGSRAEQAVAAAEKRAELWRDAIGDFSVLAAAPGALLGAQPAGTQGEIDAATADLIARLGAPEGELGGEPIAEMARRTLRRFFDKLLAREDAVHKDEDTEDVHQMRVATRRLRAALQILTGVYEPDLIRSYRKGLRRIAESLGTVRDGDVFLEHLAARREQLPAAERAGLDALTQAVAAERDAAHTKLLSYLDSKRYKHFKHAFAKFLSTPGAGVLPAPEPGMTERVRDFAGSAIWRRYELWRAYELALPSAAPETLHQARIAGKRFRYTLEFFADALGERVDAALEALTALQDTLGLLQDDVTARAHVAALGLADDPGAQAYLAGRTSERAQLLAQLPQRWAAVDSDGFRRDLFEMIVAL